MPFKDILVHIDNSKQSASRLELAIDLARDGRAHLTGLYAVTHSQYSYEDANILQQTVQARDDFARRTAQAEVRAQWLFADSKAIGVGVAEVLNRHCYSKDLVVVGQRHPDAREGETSSELPEGVICGSGRPVLVIPHSGKFHSVGRRVLVAWKNGREAARAVNDAMPLLLAADQVTVVAIERSPELQPAEGSRTGEIAQNLERHGVNLRQETLISGGIPVADVLMEYAWENGCDLLVMGVAGTAQKMSPVVRQVLEQMTVPVLFGY